MELYVADGRQHQVSRAERARGSNFSALLSWGYQDEPLQSLMQLEKYRMRQVISRFDGYQFSCWMVTRLRISSGKERRDICYIDFLFTAG